MARPASKYPNRTLYLWDIETTAGYDDLQKVLPYFNIRTSLGSVFESETTVDYRPDLDDRTTFTYRPVWFPRRW